MSETETVDEQTAEMARALPAVRVSEAMVARGEISAEDVLGQRDKIKQVMDAVMEKGVHYGEIPGIDKPTLLKPGAEVLAVTFRLAPSYQSEKVFHDDSHLTVISTVTLTHIPTGLVVAEGEGLCTSREKKYAYRGEGRVCPACGEAAIKRSKYPPREGDYDGASTSDAPGWYCFGKIGGCGANFAAEDPRIIGQEAGKIANPDLPDTWNTVLKMANKRALVAAILNGTAASDIFTQDVEDGSSSGGNGSGAPEPRPQTANRETPKAWEEIYAWAEPYGPDVAWREWVKDCCQVLFKTDDATTLNGEQKRTLGQKAAGAIVALRDSVDPDRFPPPSRAEIQRAWASVLDGEILPGPPWRLSPDEESLPTYWAAHDLPEPEPPTAAVSEADVQAAEDAEFTPLDPETEQEVEDIPFGEDPSGYGG